MACGAAADTVRPVRSDRPRARVAAAALVATAAALAAAGPAAADDAGLVRAHRVLYPAAEALGARATTGESAQDAYDAARDLEEAVRRAAPVSAACRPLAGALARAAAGRVLQTEGIDRPSASDRAAGLRAAAAARAAVARAAGPCRGRGGGARTARLPMSPGDGEAAFGAVVARAPAAADAAELSVDGQPVARTAVAGGRARFATTATGRHDLRVAFSRAGAVVAATGARGAELLPRSALAAAPAVAAGGPPVAALARALAGGPRYRAAWVHDLTTGAAAGVNAGAAFPAASTVKLGLMAGALRRLGAAPERSAYAYDLRAMAGWSSNLATNRLLRRLGGPATAADGLRRLGARASTFPGEYIVGTELAPPRVSSRVTTAEDLGRMLFAIHAAAAGAPGARARTGLTAHQARLALGWLLASQQRGDNASLLAGGVPTGTPIAQKNGWIRAARHGAGILYGPRGPVIAVVLTYDEAGVGAAAARALGARVAAAGWTARDGPAAQRQPRP